MYNKRCEELNIISDSNTIVCLLVMKWNFLEQYFHMKSLTFIKHKNSMLP